MPDKNSTVSAGAPSKGDVDAALAMIFAHEAFTSSPRLSAFLRFLVQETMEGRSAQLKAYTIATGVFGLPENFDPQTNSIVRVEARRLRTALDRYYAETRDAAKVIIRLAPGSYVPRFEISESPVEASGVVPAPIANAPTPLAAAAALPGFSGRPRRWIMAALLGGVAVASLAAALPWVQRQTVPASSVASSVASRVFGQATVRVELTGVTVASFEQAERLKRNLENALSRFSTLIVHTEGRSAEAGAFDYVVSLHLDAQGDKWNVALRVLRAAVGEVVWTHNFEQRSAEDFAGGGSTFVGEIASRLARRYGVIQSDLRQQIARSATPLTGYGCILAADAYFSLPGPEAYATASICLEREIGLHPAFADARATLSRLLVEKWIAAGPAAGREMLDRAAQLAEEAIAQQPHNARSHFARFLVRFAEHRFDDAFEAGSIALAMNPNATDVTASIGAAMILRGRFAEGRALLDRASLFPESMPAWYDIYFFLDAYMRDDFEEAAKRSRRRTLARFPLGIVAKMLVAAKAQDVAEQERWSATLRQSFPGFARDMEASLAHHGVGSLIRKRILDDLRART